MILFALIAGTTVEFLNLVFVSHVWNKMSSLVIPETCWVDQQLFENLSSPFRPTNHLTDVLALY